MREGLRSRTRVAKAISVKNETVDLGGEGSEAQNSMIDKKGEVECGVKEECGFDLNVSASGNVDLTENGSASCFSGGGSCVEEDRKAKKEHVSNDEVLVGGRVLRSRSKRGDGRRLYYGENEDVFSENDGEHSGCERVTVKMEFEEADECLAGSCEDEVVKVRKVQNDKRKLKRKRGRPPKVQLKEEGQSTPKLEVKEEGQSIDQLPRKRKRGRPPLSAGQKSQNHLVTVAAHNRKRKTRLQKGKNLLTMKDGANVNPIDDTNSMKSAGDELEKKEFSPVIKDKFSKVLEADNNVVALPLRSNTVNTNATEKSGRNHAKQFVRDQIKEQLSAAGWTVDYRPRNGREYKDAVYVSLDGHTHWSITLAYKRLKEYYEAGNGEGKAYGPGFKFTPIPEEDFQILTKVITKQRKGKNKFVQKGGKGEKEVDGVNGKKNKEKSGSGAGMGKSMKRKLKRKHSHGNTDDRMAVLARDHKRHKTQNKKRCGLLVRNAEEIDSDTEGYVVYSGKRTLLSWMIDLGTVFQNGKVHYMPDKNKSAVLDGKITGDGIHCGCCNKIVSILEFEVHAGSKLADPLRNIYVEEGTSLLQCLLDSWNKQDEFERKGFHFVDVAGEDPNDDTCGVCGDGGDLICCDGCPSTFHQGCLDIKKFPSGDWHCIYCCCKFCGFVVNGSSNRRDDTDDLAVSKLLTCQLCEEKYHRSCNEANDTNTDSTREVFFCGNRCQELSERLEMLLGVAHEIEDGYSWSFIRRSDVGFDASQIKPQVVECNSKLAVALSIMDECFMPYIDHRSGTNLIHSILYNCGSNFNRLNYNGFVTAILERGDEIICAASIRIHGNQLAEMPFIGTRYMYRRRGMCRRLLNSIEWALSSLNVELLVIPAISELRETWTSVFGFEPLEPTNKQIIKNKNLLVFPHVDMLQKKIPKHILAGQNLIPTEVSNLKRNQIADTCNGMGSHGTDLIDCTNIPPSNACQINDDTKSIECGCHLPGGLLNEVPDIANDTIDYQKSSKDDTCRVVHENLAIEDSNNIENACDYVTDTRCQATDSQLNNCQVPHEDRRRLVSCISTEVSERNGVGVSFEVTENLPNQVKVAIKVISNNNSAENSSACGAECLIPESQIVNDTRDSKDFGDHIHRDSYKISNSCGTRSKTDCCQPTITVVKEVHCESGEVDPTTDVSMHLKSQNITNDKHRMKGSSELAESDSQVDQIARSNAPTLWSPNTGSGAALHCASAGSASCSSAEGIVS
ncbi:hypothetical protein Fmac_027917 [Flemingia macrophylla]|uniref:PHD-type domain-containing protein n=1 Tax=Flemingia macrophylla TaxID=520843 RepID=A0ABD1LJP1_9FABA